MNKYKFYSKSDSTKESLGMIKADNLLEAIEQFAAIKKLPLDVFTNLYEVIEM
jgi:hypothetical protein